MKAPILVALVCILCYLPGAAPAYSFSFNGTYSMVALEYDMNHICAIQQCGGFGYCINDFTGCANCTNGGCRHDCIICPTPQFCHNNHSCHCPPAWDGTTTTQPCSDTICSAGSCNPPFCSAMTCNTTNGASCDTDTGYCVCNPDTPLGSPCLGSCQVASSVCPAGGCACGVGSCSVTTPGGLGSCGCSPSWSGTGILGCDPTNVQCPNICGTPVCVTGGTADCFTCSDPNEQARPICSNCDSCITALDSWIAATTAQPTCSAALALYQVTNPTYSPYYQAAAIVCEQRGGSWPFSGVDAITALALSSCQQYDNCPCDPVEYIPIGVGGACFGYCGNGMCDVPATCTGPTPYDASCTCPVNGTVASGQPCDDNVCPGACAATTACVSGTCTTCGGIGEPCCSGSLCSIGGTCNSGTCTAAQYGQVCNPSYGTSPINDCDTGMQCLAGLSESRCGCGVDPMVGLTGPSAFCPSCQRNAHPVGAICFPGCPEGQCNVATDVYCVSNGTFFPTVVWPQQYINTFSMSGMFLSASYCTSIPSPTSTGPIGSPCNSTTLQPTTRCGDSGSCVSVSGFATNQRCALAIDV